VIPTLPSRIEELAAHYVDEIRTVQPEGPYYLMGLCIGGRIAFEVAHQFLQQGEQVALLALFGTVAPGGRKALPLQRVVHNLRRVGAVEALRRTNKKLRKKVRALAAGERDNVAEEKYRTYVPQRTYPGRVSIFKPVDRVSVFRSFAEDLGWGKLITGALDVHQVPGDHTNMFEEPRVREVAERLKACLAKAQTGPPAEAHKLLVLSSDRAAQHAAVNSA
jgi:aspartate racemase